MMLGAGVEGGRRDAVPWGVMVISEGSTEDRRAIAHCPSPTHTPPAAALCTRNKMECLPWTWVPAGQRCPGEEPLTPCQAGRSEQPCLQEPS